MHQASTAGAGFLPGLNQLPVRFAHWSNIPFGKTSISTGSTGPRQCLPELKLDGATSASNPSHLQAGVDGRSVMSGEELLAEAVRARKDVDLVDEMSVESLLTSFFLFAAYGNLDKQDHAWFYLCQATSMVFTLGLHRESTYSDLSVEEAEERRRIFWLLFITERGYALQQAKPVMLRNSIHKPQVLGSNDPILAYGFINLISIFEKLTVSLYDWVSAGGGDGICAMPPTSSIQSSLSKSISLEGVSEIQKVDILITQQWLQAMMWKLSMTRAAQPGARDDTVLPFHLPVLVGKAVMGVIGAASQGAVDAHGIGMEQKLFDLGTSVADVSRSLGSKASQHLSESTVDPRDLLWGILNMLSRIRGSQSYLLPALVERSKGVLGFDCSLSVYNLLPPTTTTTTTTAGSALSDLDSLEHAWDYVSAQDDLRDQEGDTVESVMGIMSSSRIQEDISF
ncbi:hypothetical protein EYZ11_004029 [Aspergillus tanneri]|uniref:Xylanolytic transcriptional activator regulatory domain-containing protein n=1 Tax=Aspergillus tanneri TaxID=1220188 RepID=A0A4S3JLZ8_9EURO|nr:hypothetical protein EYZ11_004029 [Aspergillus tanneri]